MIPEHKTKNKEIKPKKEKPVSEIKENIIAITVFVLILVVTIGLFTGWFGLINNDVDDGTKIDIPLENNDPFTGAEQAKVIIVGFSDYECPFCSKAENTIKEILEKYPNEVAYVFKNMPLTKIHPYAYGAALAAECANEQGKFWEYHEMLFNKQDKLHPDYLKSYAKELELDSESFNECLESQKYKIVIEKDIQTARLVGVTATPAFFINGRKIVGAHPIESFTKIIDEELKLLR